MDEVEGRRSHRGKRVFYMECRNVLCYFHRMLAYLTASARNHFITDLEFTKYDFAAFLHVLPGRNESMSKGHLLFFNRASGLTGNIAQTVDFSECVRCDEFEESIAYTFFHCSLLLTFRGDLDGTLFVLEVCSVCINMVPPVNTHQHYGFLFLFGIMRVVILTTRHVFD